MDLRELLGAEARRKIGRTALQKNWLELGVIFPSLPSPVLLALLLLPAKARTPPKLVATNAPLIT